MKNKFLIPLLLSICLCFPLSAETVSKKDSELTAIEQKMKKAETSSEMKKASGEYYAYWDRKMNSLYTRLARNYKKETNEKRFKALKESQLAWIKYRDLDTKIYSSDPDFVGSATSLEETIHLADLTRQRCEILQTLLSEFSEGRENSLS